MLKSYKMVMLGVRSDQAIREEFEPDSSHFPCPYVIKVDNFRELSPKDGISGEVGHVDICVISVRKLFDGIGIYDHLLVELREEAI